MTYLARMPWDLLTPLAMLSTPFNYHNYSFLLCMSKLKLLKMRITCIVFTCNADKAYGNYKYYNDYY